VSDTSLKGLISELAQGVDTTPAALYERQRALVRAGLLQTKPGRGPGSGVRATPESVAMLLISIMATGNLSETEERSKAISNLKSQNKSCPLTGKKTFASALAAVLASEELSKRLSWIDVERSGSAVGARLAFRRPPGEILTEQDYEEMLRYPERKANVLKKRRRGPKDTVNIITSEFGHKSPKFISLLDVRATLHMHFERLASRLKEVTRHERQHHAARKK